MKFEQNHKRKSHRINVPISVIIDDKRYSVIDWSTTGLRVEKITKDIHIGDELNISLLLPTQDSAIVLKITAVIRNEYQDTYGMEFKDISDKNHRVLRHYATFAIEGSLDHIDDLSSNLFMTNVQTPMKEPVVLTDKEESEVHKIFLKKLFYYMLFAIVFVIFVFFTLLHNYIVIYSDNGIVSGNSQIYKTPYDGTIKKIYIYQDQVIYKDQLLFEMDTKNDRELLKNLIKSKKGLIKRLKKSHIILDKLQKDLNTKSIEIESIIHQRERYLKEQYDIEKSRFKKAKKLYKNRLITYLKYRDIESKYSKFISEYESSKHNNYTNKDRLIAQQASLKIKDQIISMQKIINNIDDNIQKNSFAILSIQQKIDSAIVLSHERGKIHDIIHNSGEEVKFTDDIIVVETNNKPYILTKISSQKVSYIHIGEECFLYYSRLGITLSGKISALGDLVTSNIIQSTKSEIVVKIEIDTKGIDLRLGEYLKVYFLNDSKISKKILAFLPRGIIIK